VAPAIGLARLVVGACDATHQTGCWLSGMARLIGLPRIVRNNGAYNPGGYLGVATLRRAVSAWSTRSAGRSLTIGGGSATGR
jgi:hypothetical protein